MPAKLNPSSISVKSKASGKREFTANFCLNQCLTIDANPAKHRSLVDRRHDPNDYSTYSVLQSRTYKGRWEAAYTVDDEHWQTIPSKTQAIFQTSYELVGTMKYLRADKDCIVERPYRIMEGTDSLLGTRTYDKVTPWDSTSGSCAECAVAGAPKDCRCGAVPAVCLQKGPLNKCEL